MPNLSDLAPEVRLRNERAPELRAALQDAFALMECKKALASCDNDIARAAGWLVAGNWRAGKAISWDHEALASKALQLSTELRRGERECLEALKDCAGNLDLARRKLRGQPPLQA